MGKETSKIGGFRMTPNHLALECPISLLRWIEQLERCTQPSVEVTIPECLLECREGGLAGAMARGNVLYFKCVAQDWDDFLDVRVARHYEVKTTGNEVNAGIDGCGRGDDLFDPGVRAAYHDHHAVRCIDRQ